jgi:hypothetical protein
MLLKGDDTITCLVMKVQELSGDHRRETGIEPATFSLGS